MTCWNKNTAVYVSVSMADHALIRRVANEDGVTMSALIRAALNDYLEQRGLPLLNELGNRGRPSLPSPPSQEQP